MTWCVVKATLIDCKQVFWLFNKQQVLRIFVMSYYFAWPCSCLFNNTMQTIRQLLMRVEISNGWLTANVRRTSQLSGLQSLLTFCNCSKELWYVICRHELTCCLWSKYASCETQPAHRSQQRNSMQYPEMQCNINNIRYHTIQCNIMQYHKVTKYTIRYNEMQYHAYIR